MKKTNKISGNFINLDSTFNVPSDVVSRQVQGEEVILNLKTGTYYGLDSVGTMVWSHLKTQSPLKKAVKEIATQYDVTAEKIEGDILILVRDLHKCKLIEVH